LTEFYEQGNLLVYLRKPDSRITEFQVVHILRGIALGMTHLHRQNIIHRDLAARNILLTAGFDAVVSDFGFARTLQSQEDSGHTASEVGPVR
jgi:serine/threonine protein kinase